MLREHPEMHPLARKLGRYALRRVQDVAGGLVGSKMAPHVLRAALTLREETVGPVVQQLNVGVSLATMLAQIESGEVGENMRLAAHGDEEGKALLASFTPVHQEETRDPVVRANLSRANLRRSDLDPSIELAATMERIALQEIRRRNLDFPDPESVDFSDPMRRRRRLKCRHLARAGESLPGRASPSSATPPSRARKSATAT
jgi:hypothetical protein